jgi:hypothetical protein
MPLVDPILNELTDSLPIAAEAARCVIIEERLDGSSDRA